MSFTFESSEAPDVTPQTEQDTLTAQNSNYSISQKKISSKATASAKSFANLPSARTTSVFDRLYKTQTAASRSWVPSRKAAKKLRNKTAATTNVDEVFTRLYISSTISNTSKRVTPRHPHPLTPAKKSRPPKLAKTPLKTPSTRKADEFVYSPRMKPLTRLTFKSRYHPGLGVEIVEPIKLGYSFFQQFCEYENSGIDAEQLAKEIIKAFFKKDFPAGRRWEFHDPSVVQKSDNVYRVSMSATCKDGHRVASARGVVRFLEKEVRVENYIYDVAGNTY